MSELEGSFSGPATPPRVNDECGAKDESSRGKKRHRRAKGKKKQQRTNLMIPNFDGTDSTYKDDDKGKKKVYLRPSTNPLLKAPKNSTQFIIDDHENSNLFWDFNRVKETEDKVANEASNFHVDGYLLEQAEQTNLDEEHFMIEYEEKDFESVYKNAHHEEVNSWDESKIVEQLSASEARHKQLMNLLSQIDPMSYLEKLQKELLVLQEENRNLKLVNIALRLEREQEHQQHDVKDSPRLPDSTSRDTESDTSDSEDSSSSSDSDSTCSSAEGGCESGCCLRDSDEGEIVDGSLLSEPIGGDSRLESETEMEEDETSSSDQKENSTRLIIVTDLSNPGSDKDDSTVRETKGNCLMDSNGESLHAKNTKTTKNGQSEEPGVEPDGKGGF